MIIGVDVACWTNERGYGRFTRELVTALVRLAPSDTFVLFADSETARAVPLAGPNVRIVAVRTNVSPTVAAAAAGSRPIFDMLRLSRAVTEEKLDVFFSPSVYTYYPLPPRLAVVVCIHDAIPERFPHLTLQTRRDRVFWRLKVWLALRQARLVLTVSRYAANELAAALRVLPSRIRVATEAPASEYRPSESRHDIEIVAAKIGLPAGARWFLYVGGFNPHKNVDVLVRAHAKLVADHEDPPYLLLVGPTETDRFHKDLDRIRDAIAEAGTERLVMWIGFLPDEQLRHLHSGALGLVLPSQSEGFGLPAVEAAACGTPSVVTTESPLPELLAGGSVFVEPGDADRLQAGMRRLMHEAERSRMGKVALQRARDLSWEQSARVTLATLYEAAA